MKNLQGSRNPYSHFSRKASLGAFLALLSTRLFVSIFPLKADVTMPPIFGDHMVLQSGTPLTVWGWAEPGEKVSVQVGEATATTEADARKKWSVKLAPLPANTLPTTMTIRGKNAIVFSDVLVGDVWLCSGQSNMEFGVGATSLKGITLQDEPQIRLFTVPRWISAISVRREAAKVKINGNKDDQWSPWHPFSSYWKFIDDGYTPAVWSNVKNLTKYE